MISEEAQVYALKTYGVPRNKTIISRLGVDVCDIDTSHYNVSEVFCLVSCSFVTKIKRLDKIIDAIAIASRKTKREIYWIHIGDGPLLKEIKFYAKRVLKNKNIKYKFTGYIENHEVIDLLKNKNFSCFLNFSEHEGVPVSIMEAMACGIPTIAPNVGGVSTLFDNLDMLLMPCNSQPCDMADRLVWLSELELEEMNKLRYFAYSLVKNKYLAPHNYYLFINGIYHSITD